MHRTFAIITVVVLGISACGSEQDPTLEPVDDATTTTTLEAPGEGDQGVLTEEEASVALAWESFFTPGQPVEQAAMHLEGGLDLREALEAASSQEARVGAAVTDVRVVGDVAEVTYTLTNAETGAALLPDARGVAVRTDGSWKVSNGSFCTLLSLAGIQTTACEGQVEPEVPAGE